jgi:hypothetical protein
MSLPRSRAGGDQARGIKLKLKLNPTEHRAESENLNE